MSLLSDRQREDLHKSMLDYLYANNHIDAFNALKQSAGIDYSPDPSARYTGLLEKKWTSVIRLQKKASPPLPVPALHLTPPRSWSSRTETHSSRKNSRCHQQSAPQPSQTVDNDDCRFYLSLLTALQGRTALALARQSLHDPTSGSVTRKQPTAIDLQFFSRALHGANLAANTDADSRTSATSRALKSKRSR
ncbi:hypothetical protein NMY22_g10797 [Coprinellus aureogranulatus]|nr:hypothetical protein NMY22_g10797 [Coprinellus aureogranulatus]